MKATLHGGRKGTAKHNDQQFKSDHIDPEKAKDNRYFFGVPDAKDCYDAELQIYTELYSDALKKQNEKYLKRGQKDRVRKISDWMTCSRHGAREEISQIGDMDKHASVDDLEACLLEFADWKEQRFGSNMRICSISIHVGEATPHGHERDAWFYRDTDGIIKPGIAKALEQLGIPLPDENAPISEKNNRMMTYTAMCREKWEEIIMEHGYQLNTERAKRDLGHMDPEAWKAYCRAMEEVQAREEAVQQRENAVAQEKRKLAQQKQEFEEYKKSEMEKLRKSYKSVQAINNTAETSKNGSPQQENPRHVGYLPWE